MNDRERLDAAPQWIADSGECIRILDAIEAAERRGREEMGDAMEAAWGLIANAWDTATVDGWVPAAERWRDDHWHPFLNRARIEELKGGE